MRRSVGFLPRYLARVLVVAVLAMSAGSCTSTSQAGRGSGASPSAPPTVGDITITEPTWRPDGSNWALILMWDPPIGATVDHFEVWRNNTLIADQVTGVTWTDQHVRPDSRYTYEVRAVATDGQQIVPGSESIRTEAPDVADARLEGRFAVKLRAERSSGIVDSVENGRVVFRFAPKCTLGACSVHWTVRGHRTEVALTREGRRYRGEARTPLLIRNCFGNVVDEDVTARFRVLRAESQGATVAGDRGRRNHHGAVFMGGMQ